MNTPTDNVEDVPTIVVEEVKVTNITIVKTKAENNPPKTLTTSKDTDEENIVKKNSERTDKPKPKRMKINKKVIEDRLISAYVFDAELMLKDFKNSV